MLKFSIITPVYNSEQYLEKCIHSVLDQSYSNWEMILVDDGSKDESLSIMRRFSEMDQRIIVRSKDNEGPGPTRNFAMSLASGDYLVFLDSDDYLEDSFLFEVLKKAIEGIDLIFIDVLQEKPNGDLIKHERMSAFAGLSKHDLIGMQMTGTMPWGGCRKVVRRGLVTDNSLHFNDTLTGEEAIFSFDLLTYANSIVFIEKYLYHYVNHPISQSKSSGEGWVAVSKQMKQHLIDKGLVEEYKGALNAFAYTALCGRFLSLIKMNYNYLTIKNEMRQRIVDFEHSFDWDIDSRYLRKEPKAMIVFLRNSWFLLPTIGGKLYLALK